MNKYFKTFFVVLIISTSIISCGRYERELFTDFEVAVCGDSALLFWDANYWDANSYGYPPLGTAYISTSPNPTINSANTIRVNRQKGFYQICYDENGYHLHDLYNDTWDSKDPSSVLYCDKNYDFNSYRWGESSTRNCCAIVEDLTPNTTYYARVYTIVDGNDAYSNQISFTTKE